MANPPPCDGESADAAEDWEKLVDMASSFSCAVGNPTWLAKALSRRERVRKEDRPTLFACENNHVAVRQLKSELLGRVSVVSCMVDRICADKVVSKTGATQHRETRSDRPRLSWSE
eukprot:1082359-Prorocentrum_minimum.AAC.3